ncbi:helix-turn-helix domain-containing protein [Acetobacter cerevisiae]|uniref:Helix-turn-helix domain-containing protein n=1 Tax=Acetobacter cerevisiae TaxID=178900 RepID=A0ABT1EW34_9PROT|nr:IclR family transcriptional regulator C-terminal domain-containing protein [Acetobacter cerevisiae]MCP1246665.1 helix-turn-helix domain-containing protein [Acetobacter cerevisiae]MCP1256204.1 helix-turn-helix domain-containing protein [Acetobacter cerevisiae]
MSIEKAENISENREFVTALARGLEVLRVCAARPEGMTLSEAAQAVGLPRAAVRRSLLTLTAMGYLSQAGRIFMPTPKVLNLSARVADLPLPRLAQPLLTELSRSLDESASLATLDGMDILYIARAETNRILAVDLSVGSRLPAWCTSMGRVLLSALPAEARNQHIPEQLTARTARTVTDRVALNDILTNIRQHGYCLLDQELELGLRSVAAPVRNSAGDVVAALNVGMHATRMSLKEMQQTIVPAVIRTASSLKVP